MMVSSKFFTLHFYSCTHVVTLTTNYHRYRVFIQKMANFSDATIIQVADFVSGRKKKKGLAHTHLTCRSC